MRASEAIKLSVIISAGKEMHLKFQVMTAARTEEATATSLQLQTFWDLIKALQAMKAWIAEKTVASAFRLILRQAISAFSSD